MLSILGGLYKGRKLLSPRSKVTRPTLGKVREALFSICQQEIVGAHLLDLFAGSGAIGLEALSRGALHVSFVERERSALTTLRANISSLGVEKQTSVYPANVRTLLPTLSETFDLIYADPPYDPERGEVATELLLLVDAHPHLLAEEGRFFLETRSHDLPDLHHFFLKNQRRFGATLLYEYLRKKV